MSTLTYYVLVILGKVTPQQNKDINTHFLNAEGGGATRPGIL